MLGQTISHFQILDKLGEGGMGVVYRARDLKLDRSVALKFLPRHLSENVEEKERFIQEAKAASALDHPNICTIHEIDETDDGQLFIAMAAYEGETIKQKIRRGVLSVDEIVELGIQMTAGLAAAHDRGIIHRDVKPANFMVTPDGVVKILDFGLSKLTNAPAQLTQTGTLMGTAAYMSPEQVQGEVVDQQTDVWALGVVLYEMATGTKPFRGSNDLSTLYRIVHQEPDARSDSGRLPAPLRGVLRKALAKERNRRYNSILEMQADLARLRADTESASLPPFLRRVIDPAPTRAERMRRVQLMTAGMAVVLAALVLSVLQWWRPGVNSAPQPTQMVKMLGFEPAADSSAPKWLGLAVEELVYYELPGSSALRWGKPDQARTRSGAGGPDGSGVLSESELKELFDVDGSSYVVRGSYRRREVEGAADELTLDVWIQSTTRPERSQNLTLVGREDKLLELGSRLAERIAGALDLPASARGTRTSAPAPPVDPQAAALLEQAREAMRVFDAPRARSLAEQGLKLAPENPWLQAALADALWQLGYEQEALQHAREAVAQSRALSTAERVALVAGVREAENRGMRAAALLRILERTEGPPELSPIMPERLDRTLRLVGLLTSMQEVEEAHALLAPYLAVAPDDPRLLLAQAEVARRENDNRLQELLAARAAERAKAEGSPLLLARALFFDGEALRRLNRLDEAEAALTAALDIFEDGGFSRGQGDVLTTLGNVKWDRQDLAAALTHYEAAARLYGSINNERLRNRTLSNQALVLQQRGEFQAALETYQTVRASLDAAGDLPAEAITLVSIGEIYVRLGRFAEAADTLNEASDVADQSGLPVAISSALSASGEFLMLEGNLPEAERKLREALAIQEEGGDLQYAAEARIVLASVRYYQGDLEEAERSALEALNSVEKEGNPIPYARMRVALGEIWRSMGRKAEALAAFREALAIQDRLGNLRSSDSRLALGLLLLEDGQPAQAIAMARETLEDVARRGERPMVARANCLLALSSLALGDFEIAERSIAEGREQLAGIESPLLSWPLDLAAARLDFARHDLTRAAKNLQTPLAEMTTGGFAEFQLETRLLLIEIELEAVATRNARARLEQLAKEAEQKGFGRLALEARQSLIDIPQN